MHPFLFLAALNLRFNQIGKTKRGRRQAYFRKLLKNSCTW